MERPVLYLAVMVLLQTASGIEWEFGSNMSGSQTIMEQEGVIPSYLKEKRVKISKPKCTDVIYVKVEVEDMPTVTYNMDAGIVLIRYEKGRRAKNSEFRVTAKGTKTEGGKCRGPTPKAVTGYPGGINPYDATPYFQFSKEYTPREYPNNAIPNDAHHDVAHPNDAHNDDSHPYDAHQDNAHPYDAHQVDTHAYDAPQVDTHAYDAPQVDTHEYDAPQVDTHAYDVHAVDTHTYEAHQVDAHPHDAHANVDQPDDVEIE